VSAPIADCLDRGEPPLPWVYRLAADLEGEDRADLPGDAGALSRSLSTAADLFGLPAVCPSFDPAITAEAAGCAVADDEEGGTLRVTDGPVESVDDAFDLDVDGAVEGGRMPAALDATERLTATLDGTSVLGGIAGPGTLADALLSVDDPDPDLHFEATLTAGDVGVALANAFFDRGADGIVVLEPDGVGGDTGGGGGGTDEEAYRDAVVPLSNVIDHYDATAILAQRSVGAADVELAADLGFDAITGRAGDDAVDAAADAGIALGVGVPADLLLDGPDAVDSFVDDHPSDTFFATEWEVPAGVEPEALHQLMGSL